MKQYILGVDVGGSHITAAVVDMLNRKIIEESRTRKKIDSFGEASVVIKEWGEVILESNQKSGNKANQLGMALPGPFDYEAGISLLKDNNKYVKLYGLNVKNLLSEVLDISSENILMGNDANCFLAGEKFSGIVKKYDKVLGITLGTGLGSAIFSENTNRDADLWHMPFKDGIAEDYISSRWFLKRYYELSGINVMNVKDLASLHAESLTVQRIFKEFSQNLAQFIIEVFNQINVDAIVLGGNISNAWPYFLNHLQTEIQRNNLQVDILISSLNEDATIIGAASAWHHKNKIK